MKILLTVAAMLACASAHSLDLKGVELGKAATEAQLHDAFTDRHAFDAGASAARFDRHHVALVLLKRDGEAVKVLFLHQSYLGARLDPLSARTGRYMHTEILKYEADGLKFESHLYFDKRKTDKRPAVLVFPEAFGLGDHAKSKAKRLVELGFVTLGSDLHGEGKIVRDLGAVMRLIGPLMADPSGTRTRAKAGLAALKARPEVDAARIAAIGYCFGGTMALELARSGSDVVGVAGFHSGLGTARPQDARNIKGKVLVCIGADDPMIGAEPREAFVQEMRAGGVDWQMELYGGVVHSFTNPEADKQGNPALKYDAKADVRSWAKLQAFLDEIFA